MKKREIYNTNTGKVVTVYSLAEELQHYVSMGFTMTAELIAEKHREWETTITEGQKKVIKDQRELRNFISEHHGVYTHALYEYGKDYLGELNNLDLVRLCILATYASSSGKCYDVNGNEIKRSSLANIWDVSRSEVGKTYNRLLEANALSISEKKQIIVNTNIFKYGKMEGIKMNEKTYTRMFNEKLLGLYHNTPKKSRKQIGMMIRLLPYINYRYNILCKNPSESDEKRVQPLNWMEVCDILGQDADATVTRTKNTLMKLKIDDFDVVGYFSTGSGYHICINPKVYYGGGCIEDVKYLYTMFKMPLTK